MREQCITFETAKLAKEKGFDEICEFTYNLTEFIPKRKKGIKNSEFVIAEHTENSCSAPTQSLLQKWIREEHQIHIQIVREEDEWKYQLYEFSHGNKYIPQEFLTFDIYEEALESGLFEALKLIK